MSIRFAGANTEVICRRYAVWMGRLTAARETAGQIAQKCSPLGVAQAKKMIYQHLFTDLATAIKEDDDLSKLGTDLLDNGIVGGLAAAAIAGQRLIVI